jgi:hypothetical protein
MVVELFVKRIAGDLIDTFSVKNNNEYRRKYFFKKI